MIKKVSILVLTVLMFFTLMTSNANINVVNADDTSDSCEVDRCLISTMLFREYRREIKYVYSEDGSTAKPSVVQRKSFDGTVTFDNVTGEIVDVSGYTPAAWTFDAVESPEIPGYTPDKAVVNEFVLSPKTNDTNVCPSDTVVTYYPNSALMQVNYVFNDNVLQTVNEDGKTNEAFTYDPANDIEEWLRKGYKVISNNYPQDGIYDTIADTSDNISQVYTIVLGLNIIEKEEQKVVKRQIDYRFDDEFGEEAAPSVEDNVNFIRVVTATGLDETFGPWDPESATFGEVTSPEVSGYVPSRAKVDAVTVTGDSQNIRIVVIYTENISQLANIKIIDIDANDEVLFDTDVVGDAGEPIGYDVQPKLEDYIKAGYEVVENPYDPNIEFDDDPDVDQEFVIKLRHTYIEICHDCEIPECINEKEPACDVPDPSITKESLNVKLYRTIKYIYDGTGEEAAPLVEQPADFNRSVTINRVTGAFTYSELQPAQVVLEEVVSPKISGYTADKQKIDATTIASSKALSYMPSSDAVQITEELVIYSKIPQKGVVHFVDTEGKSIGTDVVFDGGSLENFPEDVKTNKDNTILALLADGYELISDEYEAEENKVFDIDPDVDQEYVVTLKEREVIIPYDDPKTPGEPACEDPCKVQYPDGLTYNDLNKEFIRTIHHVDKNDVKLLDDVTQDAAERYTFKYNLVTKVLTLIDTKIENYPEYKAPDIEKMSKDRDVVPADNRLENLEETIVYTKITYKVTFIDGLTGEELKIEVVDPGDDATAPEIPVHENYISKGWDKDFTNIQSDLVVTVNYDPIEKPVCVVKFMDGLTGKLIDVQQIECGNGAKDPGKPEHENYTPGDWDKPFDKVEVPELIVTVNYERNKCRVMFIDGLVEKEDVCKIWGDKYTGGGLIADVEYYCGDPVTPPTPTKHDGYEFDGWVKADCKMIIYAKYRKITVKPMVPTGVTNILESLFNVFK